MKTLYLDCGMGAAGDMLTAALLELWPDQDAFLAEMNGLGIPDICMEKETVTKCGILGTHISVKVKGMEEDEHMHDHSLKDGHDEPHSHHHHSGMHEIEHIISHLQLTEKVKQDILAVYELIAEAESSVHGVSVTDVHFHEVGTMDAIADITAVCLLMNYIAPDEVIVSPVHVGSGHVRCAHGILPVPAPATAYILKDIPVYGGSISGELCTPTGAALLKYFATRFGEMPMMRVSSIGYGMGKKDFEKANCVRAMLGETKRQEDRMIELSCNVDDMTAEDIGFAMERLFEGGALEVYTVPIGMKKSRPGILLRVMCTEQKREEITELIFRHTTTIGIREAVVRRYVLDRKLDTVETPYGQVRCKISSGYGVKKSKYEYEDISRIAREKGIGMEEVRRLLHEL
ncbi:MAG: nickel pincer cofactor biosynthesis protein LarC [Bacillota bacterium]|nr:nickel pincer cofactor biosynthesis protein LarC [Bacillota bacterium]